MKEMHTVNKKTTTIVILSTLILTSIALNTYSIGLGFAPSRIEINNALKGGIYERTLIIYNTNPEEGYYSLEVEGEVKDWVTFYSPDEKEDIKTTYQTKIPAKNQKEVIARFTIPVDTANGEYKTTIYAKLVPGEETTNLQEEDTGQSVTVKMPSEVTIKVTGEQIVKAAVRSITIKDVEADYPVRADVTLYNEGNVKIRPKIYAEIRSPEETTLKKAEHTTTQINPQEIKTISVEIPTDGLTTGNYSCYVEVQVEDKKIEEKKLKFSILPRGSLTAEGKLIKYEAPSWITLGVVHKTIAYFQNTGEIDVKAKIKGEVYNPSGELLDTVEGEQVLVKTEETAGLTAYYKPPQEGEYMLKYTINYEGKTITLDPIKIQVRLPEQKTTTTTQPKKEADTTSNNLKDNTPVKDQANNQTMLITAIAAVFVILAAVYLAITRRKKN